MKKYWKWFAALAVIGTAAGLIIAYFCKKKCKGDGMDDDMDFTDDDDFDLDVDLKPISDREYVPLKKAVNPVTESTDDAEESPEEEVPSEEASEEDASQEEAKDPAPDSEENTDSE